MLACALNSGSNGNCLYVEAPAPDGRTVRLLLDAGISGKQAAERLAGHGRDIRAVDAVIISHDHADHVRCAGVFARKFGLPVYMSTRTHAAAAGFLGTIPQVTTFRPGQTLDFFGVTVETHATPHDAAEPVVFVISAGGRRLGVLTDLGCVFSELPGLLGGLDAVFLESNYDPEMLRTGPYPVMLQRRIAGPHGHISNHESAELVRSAGGARLQWVALAHLSEANNTPDLARQTHDEVVGRVRPMHVTSRHAAGPLLRVE